MCGSDRNTSGCLWSSFQGLCMPVPATLDPGECLRRESGRGWVQPPSPASRGAAARKPRQHVRLLPTRVGEAESRENILTEVKSTCCCSWGLSGGEGCTSQGCHICRHLAFPKAALHAAANSFHQELAGVLDHRELCSQTRPSARQPSASVPVRIFCSCLRHRAVTGGSSWPFPSLGRALALLCEGTHLSHKRVHGAWSCAGAALGSGPAGRGTGVVRLPCSAAGRSLRKASGAAWCSQSRAAWFRSVLCRHPLGWLVLQDEL